MNLERDTGAYTCIDLNLDTGLYHSRSLGLYTLSSLYTLVPSVSIHSCSNPLYTLVPQGTFKAKCHDHNT